MFVNVCVCVSCRPYVTVNVSCGLLDVRLSSDVVDLASRVLHTVTDVITPQACTCTFLYLYIYKMATRNTEYSFG